LSTGYQPEFDPRSAFGLGADEAGLDSLFMEGTPGEPDGGEEADPADTPSALLESMIELGERYQKVERDAEDRATMAQVLATLRKYQAREAKALAGAQQSTSAAMKYLGRRSG